MCLSLIQENVSLYSSYFTQTEKEDTELDIIVPCKRIPNWIKSREFLSDESNDTKSNEGDDDINFPSPKISSDADSISSDIYEDEQGLAETSSSSDEVESSTEGSGEEEHDESDTDKYSDTEDDDEDGSDKGRYSDS